MVFLRRLLPAGAIPLELIFDSKRFLSGIGREAAELSERKTTDAVRTRRLRQYYERVDAHDVTGLLDLFADDAVYHRPGYEPLVGRADLEQFYLAGRVIREGRHSVRTAVVDGAEAAVHGEFDGVLKDGRAVSLRFADFFVFNDEDAIQRRDTFFFTPLV